MKIFEIYKIGKMAVAMKTFDMRIRKWLEDEGKQARFRKAEEHPEWVLFQRTQSDFHSALYVFVRKYDKFSKHA